AANKECECSLIVIEGYKPHWPEEFEHIRAALQRTLGELALRIDHIGSTSVPGLGAKDVIDVQITVRDFSPDLVQRMLDAGYQYRADIIRDHVPLGDDPNPSQWEKRYFREQAGQRRTHIHVRQAGNANQRYALLFRDYLRAHPRSAQSIEHLKREIAKRHDDIDIYLDIKEPAYDLIWDAAQEWADLVSWQG
ncbi:MAG TPA: GrpB family protein, partial [Roseiflexaceae bacterium]|nr:GrpB family protein [Roseiflexaceae bacterium]